MTHALAAALLAALATSAAPTHTPDPRTVVRHGAGYRYTQAGWTVLHIEGKPYERGEQHGRLLSHEIAAHLRCYSTVLAPTASAEGWRMARTLTSGLFLRGYLPEYLEEMKGIADGASAAGARIFGRRIDVLDIATLNSWPEIDTLESALSAVPTGLETLDLDKKVARAKIPPKPERCSAFAATGPATKDGKIVFGHITMFSLYPANFYNVWLDVKPATGHRVVMQTFPGGIHSGLDYYMNDKGLLVTETTISQTRFDGKGAPLASRIRQVMQYADTIDKAIEILTKSNNGLYTNEWLLGDTKTNEIAMFELGTHKTKLWRSSKDEWFGGTKGFYWGCNNTKDLDLRLETLTGTGARPGRTLFAPSERDKKWLELFDAHNGKIDAAFARKAFTTPPLASFSSVDAKYTTTDMAAKMESWALFGPPLGRTWHPTDGEKAKYPEVRPLVSNPWTVLGINPPAATTGAAATDVFDPVKGDVLKSPSSPSDIETATAYRGTLVAADDGALWLAAAFPAYERILALEEALAKARDDGKLTAADLDRVGNQLFDHKSMYELGARSSKDVTLSKLMPSMRSNDWHRIAQGKGVLLLHALRTKIGVNTFTPIMDRFGAANAGKEVTSQAFRAFVAKESGENLDAFFAAWLDETGLPDKQHAWGAKGGAFGVTSFYPDVEKTLIVYGTRDEAEANADAAELLRKALLRRGANVSVAVKKDAEVTEAELTSHHLLLVGRPGTNAVAEAMKSAFPVEFSAQSVKIRGEWFAHADTAVMTAGVNPKSPRFSVVLLAGLSAEATVRLTPRLADRGFAGGEIVLYPRGGAARVMASARTELPDRADATKRR